MADPLLYNALDSYLYMDTMLAKATAQASAADTNRATKSTLAQCCICCWCLCMAQKALCDTPQDPNIQRIIDENLHEWECTKCIPDHHGCTGWTTCCLHWPNGQGQCNNSSMSCTWTAPANTDCIQIDMWGAGAASYGVSCCGGADGGGTGAFVSITMPWCAGWTVQTCAGCAQCCYISGYPSMGSGTQINNGRASCAAGCGFAITANGGKSGTKRILQGTPVNKFANQCFGNMGGGSGQCYCNQGYFCYTSSCSTCGIIGPVENLTNFGICYCGQTATTNHGFSVMSVGVPGMIGCRCFDTGFGGYIKSVLPPRFPLASCNCSLPSSTTCCNAYCTTNFSSCSVCCGNFGNGFAQWPGSGGRGGKYQDGGCRYGDMGRGGGFRIIVHSCA